MPTPSFDLDDHPRRHIDSAYRAIADEGGLVVLAGRAEVKVMNPAGIAIFALLDGKHSIREIAGKVGEEFDVTPDQAISDVKEFLADLDAHGMLMRHDSADGEES